MTRLNKYEIYTYTLYTSIPRKGRGGYISCMETFINFQSTQNSFQFSKREQKLLSNFVFRLAVYTCLHRKCIKIPMRKKKVSKREGKTSEKFWGHTGEGTNTPKLFLILGKKSKKKNPQRMPWTGMCFDF